MADPPYFDRVVRVGIFGWAFLLILFGVTILALGSEVGRPDSAYVGLIPLSVGLAYLVYLGWAVGRRRKAFGPPGEGVRVRLAREPPT